MHRFTDGFAARLSAAQLEKVRSDPDVAAIEQDQIVRIDTTQQNPTWGLDRIDQAKLPLSHSYGYTHTGSGVDAYVIDTGIETSLSQFGGRANTVYGRRTATGTARTSPGSSAPSPTAWPRPYGCTPSRCSAATARAPPRT